MYRYKNSILKRKEGITLIALVITIIVLLILAGISVSMLTGNNGILGKTTEAKFKSKISEYNEELKLYISNKKIEYMSNGESYDEILLEANNEEVTYNGNQVESETIENILTTIDNKYKEKIRISSGKLKYKGNDNQEEIWLANIVEGINENVEISKVETTEEKQNSIILDNSTEHEVSNLKIYGNSEQKGTPTPDSPVEVESLGENSRNLFDKETMWYQKYIETDGKVHNGNGQSAIIPVKPNTTYTIHRLSGVRFRMALYDSYPTYGSLGTIVPDIIINEGSTTATFTTNENTTYVMIWLRSPLDTFTEEEQKNAIQFEENTIETEYKPYKYIDVVSSGNNLVDTSKFSSNGYLDEYGVIQQPTRTDLFVSEYYKIPLSKKITVSGMEPGAMYAPSMCFYDKDKIFIYGEKYNDAYVKTFNIPDNAKYFRTTFRSVLKPTFKVEEGTIATTYESYQEPITTTIDLTGHEHLRRIGNVSDYIDYKNKKIVRNIYKKVFNGTEVFRINNNDKTTNYATSISAQKSIPGGNGVCTHYIFAPYAYALANNYGKVGFDSSGTAMSFTSTDMFSTELEFKSFLAEQYANGTPVTVYYQLATPTEENIDLPEIKTFNGTTNISIDSNITPSKIECDYFKNVQ